MYLPASSNLIKLRRYLDRFAQEEQPDAFEFLVASAFKHAFHLPFQTEITKDDKEKNRVIWHGWIDKNSGKIHKSDSGQDATCFAYGFYILLESTLIGNSRRQWRREFMQAITHYENFLAHGNLSKEDVYTMLVAPDFHNDTYVGFKQKAVDGINIMIMKAAELGKLSEICKKIRTLRHLDLRHLFKKMVTKLCESTSLAYFKKDISKCIAEWEEDLIRQEKTVYFGLKSYEAMKKVGRDIVGASEIMSNLDKDKRFERYIKKLGEGDLSKLIKEALLNEKLARIVLSPREDFFCKVEESDFRARGLRLIGAVERIDK